MLTVFCLESRNLTYSCDDLVKLDISLTTLFQLNVCLLDCSLCTYPLVWVLSPHEHCPWVFSKFLVWISNDVPHAVSGFISPRPSYGQSVCYPVLCLVTHNHTHSGEHCETKILVTIFAPQALSMWKLCLYETDCHLNINSCQWPLTPARYLPLVDMIYDWRGLSSQVEEEHRVLLRLSGLVLILQGAFYIYILAVVRWNLIYFGLFSVTPHG